MTWYTYAAETRLDSKNAKMVDSGHNCPLCYSKLQRLAWRELLPPYHWQPFGFICSTCNAVYVGADARLTPPKGKRGPYAPSEILERAKPKPKGKPLENPVQRP